MRHKPLVVAAMQPRARVVCDVRDGRRDYWMPLATARKLWSECKMERVEVYQGEITYYDPQRKHYDLRIQ